MLFDVVQYWLDVKGKEWLHEIRRSGEDKGFPSLIVATKDGMVQIFYGDSSWF